MITRYNHSVMYALAVYQLGQAILAEYERGSVEVSSEGGE